MPLKFWLGGAASDKSRRLIKYILEEAERNPQRQYLMVVPEQFGLSTQQELVSESPNKGILNIDVLSFTRLAHRIGDEVGSFSADITTLDEMGKSLLIGMLAEKHKKELSVFGDNLEKPGYTDRIKSVISEFMQYGISVDKAAALSETAKAAGRGLLSKKLADIAFIYERFREYTKDRYTTVEETLDAVSSLVPHSDTIKNSVIVFDGFTGFTPVQNKLIGVLMEYALDIHVALLLEDCIQENNKDLRLREHELFYLSKNTMNQLGRMADERHVIIADPYKADKTVISNTCNSKGQIVYTDPPKNPKLNNAHVQAAVHVLAGRDPLEEIRMIVTGVEDLVRDSGYRYRDIAILTGDMESYRHTIEREFGRHDIPFFIDRTEPILLNPFIEYIRSFLDVICDNYSQNAIFRFLKSGLTECTDEEINILENYCMATGIKGRAKWHARFDTHTKSVGADELLGINGTRERFVKKCDLFTGELSDEVNVNSRFSVRQFCTALYRLIESDGVEEKLGEASRRFEESGNRKLSEQYGKIYVQIMNILDELCTLIPDETTDIRGFGDLLDSGLSGIRIGIIPTGMDYVQVGDLTRSRFDNIKALFIVGANDGVIPSTASSGGIINENEREFMKRADETLVLAPSAREDIYTQQLYIYMAQSKPTEHLYLSYSCTSASGRSLLPSYIVKKALSEHPGTKIERRRALPSYYSDEEEAFEALSDMIYPAMTGQLTREAANRVKGLMKYFLSSDRYRQRILNMVKKELIAGADRAEDTIGEALARAIYGKSLVASITRLEAYANCAYRYFLEYGLSLRDREVFSFEARDIGTIFHDSMKEYSLMMQERGKNWAHLPDEERDSLMDEAVSKVIERYRDTKLATSARYAYMEHRIRRIMKKSADIVSSQIRRGDFTPKYFEVDFDSMDSKKSLSMKLSDDEMIRLRGRIDRVDTCETDDGIYIRVIDYKSSHHEMDLAAVYEGRQLQLLVYLNAVMESERLSSGDNGTKIIPAGVLYYQMDDPLIDAKEELTEEDIHRLIMKKLRLSGLVNSDLDVLKLMDRDLADGSDVLGVSVGSKGELKSSRQTVTGEDFEVLSEHVSRCISKMGREILGGNIAIPEPDGKQRFTGPDCSYCPFDAICQSRRKTAVVVTEDDENGTGGAKEKVKMSNDDWIALMKGENE